LISDYIAINHANIWERIWYATGQMKGIDMINWKKVNDATKTIKESLSRLSDDEKEIVFEEIHK
jgi:hypothetical protein